ncbi:MAG: NAD(P)/FAD-dependent oxidoreductase [Rhabdochlamydiaceae bacterium]
MNTDKTCQVVDVLVIGGGAAGFFAAINTKLGCKDRRVVLLEKGSQFLTKVKISGGGRCNVTHDCFDPKTLTSFYPRGHKELLSVFFRFQPKDTIRWFEERGVVLKTEKDGRIFPITDSSQTIIDCLVQETKKHNIDLVLKVNVDKIVKKDDYFLITTKEGESWQSSYLIIATGSSRQGHELVSSLGHEIKEPVPSLFTFNVPSSYLKDLSGVSLQDVLITLEKTNLHQRGPLLITHFGFSGPAILKLSAWAARYLNELDYKTYMLINWIPSISLPQLEKTLCDLKKTSPRATLDIVNPFKFPKKLWKALIGEEMHKPLGFYSDKELCTLAYKLQSDRFLIEGKTLNKEEFVTCGGVSLKEVNFKTMESKLCPGLYFSGEILDVDGVTGGFNFQNAWSSAFVASQAISDLDKRLEKEGI